MARQWLAAVVAAALVAGPAQASAGAGRPPATPDLSRAAMAVGLHPGEPLARPGGAARVAARGLSHGEIRSSNWSGYAVSGGHGGYRSVSATWTEPAVTCTAGARYASFWVGLDGYSSRSVEQTGTDADCSGEAAGYRGWYEMYPAPPVYFRSEVRPGDRVSASVTFRGGDTYRLVLRDSTRGWVHAVTRHEAGLGRSSAEVITEAPSSPGRVLRLADFGTVRFDAASANGALLKKQDPAKIVMVGGGGLGKDSTSPMSKAGAFHNTWIRSG